MLDEELEELSEERRVGAGLRLNLDMLARGETFY